MLLWLGPGPSAALVLEKPRTRIKRVNERSLTHRWSDLLASLAVQTDTSADRRSTILDAAEQCFVQHGFHRTTMQDLARTAGMSVGNLYRYFPAKDAVVLALAERDRAEAAQHLCEDDAEQWPTLVRLIRHHLVEASREKAVLLVEVWAEGSRNPTVAAVLERFDAENQTWITGVLRNEGALSLRKAAALADRIRIEAQGIQVARALSVAYDPAPAVDRLIAAVEAELGKAARPAVAATLDALA